MGRVSQPCPKCFYIYLRSLNVAHSFYLKFQIIELILQTYDQSLSISAPPSTVSGLASEQFFGAPVSQCDSPSIWTSPCSFETPEIRIRNLLWRKNEVAKFYRKSELSNELERENFSLSYSFYLTWVNIIILKLVTIVNHFTYLGNQHWLTAIWYPNLQWI